MKKYFLFIACLFLIFSARAESFVYFQNNTSLDLNISTHSTLGSSYWVENFSGNFEAWELQTKIFEVNRNTGITNGTDFFLTTTALSNDASVTESKPFLSIEKKELRATFVGKWTSKQSTKKGGIKESTISRSADSRYVVEHKISDNKSVLLQESNEVGIWGVSGGIYFTVFRGWLENGQVSLSDPTDAYNYDAYKIKHVSPTRLIYENLSSGNEYIYTKVN